MEGLLQTLKFLEIGVAWHWCRVVKVGKEFTLAGAQGRGWYIQSTAYLSQGRVGLIPGADDLRLSHLTSLRFIVFMVEKQDVHNLCNEMDVLHVVPARGWWVMPPLPHVHRAED